MWLILIILAGFWWTKSQQPQRGVLTAAPAKILSPISDILTRLFGRGEAPPKVPGANLLGAPLHVNNPEFIVSGPSAIRPTLRPIVYSSGGGSSGGAIGSGTGTGGAGYGVHGGYHGLQQL